MNISNLEKIYRAIYQSGEPDRSKGFGAWQKRAQIVRRALLEARKQADKQLAEWSEVYTEKGMEQLRADLEREYYGIRKLALDDLFGALDQVEDEKREQYRKIALTAPTEDQIRLLQAMSLRDDLTPSEVGTVAEQLGENLQALKALASIARKAGITIPPVLTTEDFEEAMEAALSYARDTLNDIDAPDGELGYNSRCFYLYNGVGMPQAVFEPLDSPMFAAVQMSKSKPSSDATAAQEQPPTSGSKGSTKMWSKVTLDGSEYVSTVARQFHVSVDDIQKANPGVDLIHTRAGQTLLVPSTRLKVEAGNGHVQESQVTLVPAPTAEA